MCLLLYLISFFHFLPFTHYFQLIYPSFSFISFLLTFLPLSSPFPLILSITSSPLIQPIHTHPLPFSLHPAVTLPLSPSLVHPSYPCQYVILIPYPYNVLFIKFNSIFPSFSSHFTFIRVFCSLVCILFTLCLVYSLFR